MKSLSFVMISLTGRVHADSLGTVNGGVDGFTDSSRSDKNSLTIMLQAKRLVDSTFNFAFYKPENSSAQLLFGIS